MSNPAAEPAGEPAPDRDAAPPTGQHLGADPRETDHATGAEQAERNAADEQVG